MSLFNLVNLIYKKEIMSLENNQDKFTIVGTNIDEVKRLNANSGMTYNELNEWFAKEAENNDKTYKPIHSVNQEGDKG